MERKELTVKQFAITLAFIRVYLWLYFLANENKELHWLWLMGSLVIINFGVKYINNEKLVLTLATIIAQVLVITL